MANLIEQDHWTRRAFAEFERSLNGDSAGAVHRLRRNAFEHFTSSGFPTVHDEEWRFTSVQPIANRSFRPVLSPSASALTAQDIDRLSIPSRYRLVFVNGHFDPSLSSDEFPNGVRAGSLAAFRKSDKPFVDARLGTGVKGTESAFSALNTTFIRDGVFLHIAAGSEVADEIAIVHVVAGTQEDMAVQPRNLLVSDERSSARVVEYYCTAGADAYLHNAVTEIVVDKGARLEHTKVQVDGRSSYHMATTHVRQERGSVYHANSFALGGAIARNELTSLLADERCECTLNGLSIGDGTQLIDNHTTIDHASPNCNSWEVYKAVLGGSARGVFNGKIYVRKDAQKTDAKQTNKTLLLSDSATIDTKPQLEIFADDVKCTHGATVGQLDEQQVFYLRSRGIGEGDARDILTFAFAGEIVANVSMPAVRERLEVVIRRQLDEGRKPVAA